MVGAASSHILGSLMAVRPGRRAGSHRSVAPDGRQEMPLLMGAPIEGYLRTDRPDTWKNQTERWRMGAPMVSSRCECALSVRCP